MDYKNMWMSWIVKERIITLFSVVFQFVARNLNFNVYSSDAEGSCVSRNETLSVVKRLITIAKNFYSPEIKRST